MKFSPASSAAQSCCLQAGQGLRPVPLLLSKHGSGYSGQLVGFYASLADWELQWINTPKSHWKRLDAGSGDELACASELLAKWKPALDAAYA